jgi:1-acyl-sn-glycerol-3-phosphate acyltransferase
MRGIIGVIWLIISTVLYACLTMVVGVFFPAKGRLFGKMWAQQLLAVTGITLTVHGIEKVSVKTSVVYMPNHSSALDIIILLAAMPTNLVFISKRELFLIPIMGWGMVIAGHIALDRSSPRKAMVSLQKACNDINKRKVSVIVFPEGTRSTTGEIAEFKSGTFQLPLTANIPIVPVFIRGAHTLLPKKATFPSTGVVDVYIADSIPVHVVTAHSKKELAVMARDSVVRLKTESE